MPAHVIPIVAGPHRDELVALVLSDRTIQFRTTTGSAAVHLAEVEEMDSAGRWFWFTGKVLSAQFLGAPFVGVYDCLRHTGEILLQLN